MRFKNLNKNFRYIDEFLHITPGLQFWHDLDIHDKYIENSYSYVIMGETEEPVDERDEDSEEKTKILYQAVRWDQRNSPLDSLTCGLWSKNMLLMYGMVKIQVDLMTKSDSKFPKEETLKRIRDKAWND